MGLLEWTVSASYHVGLELLMFVLVDIFVKSPLKSAATESEKRVIWLYESLGLLALCVVLYLVHHVPYILMGLTSITFIYTQICGRADLASFVASLRAHWENHLQHEESMKQLERQKQQQQQLQQQALGMAGLNHSSAAELNNINAQNQEAVGFGVSFPFFTKQGSLHYPPNATVVPGQDRPSYSMNPGYQDLMKHSQGIPFHTAGRNWSNAVGNMNSFVPGPVNQINTNLQCKPLQEKAFQHRNDSNERKSFWPNLQRRSLRPEPSVGGLLPKPISSSSSIKSKFMNVIGFGSTTLKPVGLVNNGQNMCFINSMLQCLARGPFLVECLTADSAKELECTVAESELLSSLAEVLDILTIDPSSSDYKVFNANRFRKAVSVLNPGLVTPPGEVMHQQDVAEFLMWLLATVHGILNKNRQALECDTASTPNDERFSSPRLANLKLIYGDLNANRIQDLKDQCRREIAVANGLENESYAEAIQRLSDLEWLTHKQNNDTIIDGLFTGQLVEAYHSLEHGHISVALQAFNILPVPIAAPRYSSGLVVLEDCFANFCNIENLSEVPPVIFSQQQQHEDVGGLGRNPSKEPLIQLARRRNLGSLNAGLRSTPVTRKLIQESHMPSPIHQSVFPSQMLSDFKCQPVETMPMSPPLSSLSAGDTTGNQDIQNNGFRTSTPLVSESRINQRGMTVPVARLQRRCLLRQLPECLIIQLMRFRYDQVARTPTKVSTSVTIRLRDFNLKNVVYDTVTQRNDLTASVGGFVYELYALCLHLGGNSTSHGHYINYCLDGDKWYRMDDQDVIEVNMEYQLSTEEIRQNAYLLFYRRVNSDNV